MKKSKRLFVLAAVLFTLATININLTSITNDSQSFSLELLSKVALANPENADKIVKIQNRKHRYNPHKNCYYQCLDYAQVVCEYTHGANC